MGPIFILPLGTVFLQKVQAGTPEQSAALWIVVLVIGAAIGTTVSVIISQYLNKIAKVNEERFERIEKNIEKICETNEEIRKAQYEFNTHIHLQKEQNKYHTTTQEDNKKKIDELYRKLDDVVMNLLKK